MEYDLRFSSCANKPIRSQGRGTTVFPDDSLPASTGSLKVFHEKSKPLVKQLMFVFYNAIKLMKQLKLNISNKVIVLSKNTQITSLIATAIDSTLIQKGTISVFYFVVIGK